MVQGGRPIHVGWLRRMSSARIGLALLCGTGMLFAPFTNPLALANHRTQYRYPNSPASEVHFRHLA
jgi:hypothetical protein